MSGTAKIITRPSPNYNTRKAGAPTDTIVIHHTATNDLQTALKILTGKEFEVSSHYLIDKDSTVYQLVEESQKAWHAGASHWRGREKINDYSIGIELVNNGFEPFPPAQMNGLLGLCHDIMSRHPIDHRNIIGHFDIAPTRKIDPNHFFDWKHMFENDLGIYSTAMVDEVRLLHRIGDKNNEIADARRKLSSIGYKISNNDAYDQELNNIIVAFKRHYVIESYELAGWDNLSDARLNDLLAVYHV